MTFEQIKNDRLKFNLDKGEVESIETASAFQGTPNFYIINSQNDNNVTFSITSNLPYGDEKEKGTYKVTRVWLSSDNSETNLLSESSKEFEVR